MNTLLAQPSGRSGVALAILASCLVTGLASPLASARLANSPPQVSGSPPSRVAGGQSYSFRPVATDADGDRMTFKLYGRPWWMTFDVYTGQLGGEVPGYVTPGTVYPDLVIVANDGKADVALPPFSITVAAAADGRARGGSGTAAISWRAPQTSISGAALSGLAGYRLYYGRSAGALTTSIAIGGAGNTAYTVTNLAKGVWYFAVTAYTAAGEESAKSAMVSKTIAQ